MRPLQPVSYTHLLQPDLLVLVQAGAEHLVDVGVVVVQPVDLVAAQLDVYKRQIQHDAASSKRQPRGSAGPGLEKRQALPGLRLDTAPQNRGAAEEMCIRDSVYEMLSPRLHEDEKVWLKEKCAPIGR